MKKLNADIIKEVVLKKDNMIILILTGVLLLIIAWPVKETTKTNNNVSDLWDKSGVKNNSSSEYGNENKEGTELIIDGLDAMKREEYLVTGLEERLEEMLSSMQGVGQVMVMITLASQGEKIVEKDIPLERSNIVEKDSQGGSRSTNEMYSKEETVYTVNAQGDKIPYVTKETGVEVAGVSVVAQGGDDAQVQKNISDVIQALFGIEEHKIKVVKMKKQE